MFSSTAIIIGFFGFSLVFLSLGAALVLRSKTFVKVVATQQINEKTYFAIRIDGFDFLFFKNKETVEFLNSLEEVEDFKEIDLDEFRKANEKNHDEALKIPKFEKAS